MKFTATAVVLASVVSSTFAAVPASLLKNARRVEDANAAAEDEYNFLQNYSLKLLRCKSGETYVSPVDGTYEYSSVVFRLCPDSCDSDTVSGCKEGYGDYVVGLNTFAASYLQEKREDMQGDDNQNNWKFEEFGECRAWDVDKDAGIEDEDAVFYVGPACTEDGTGVKSELFQDETCQTASETYTFEQISNGISLPYSTGGLISDNCESCYRANDKGEMELTEFCTDLYQYSGKCESQMAEGTFHYMGKQEGACETIKSMLPAAARSGKAGKAIGWTIFVLVVVGAAAYGFMQYKKKQDDKRAGLMA